MLRIDSASDAERHSLPMNVGVVRPASCRRWFGRLRWLGELGALVGACSALLLACGSDKGASPAGAGGSAVGEGEPTPPSGEMPPPDDGSELGGGGEPNPYDDLPVDMPPVSAW